MSRQPLFCAELSAGVGTGRDGQTGASAAPAAVRLIGVFVLRALRMRGAALVDVRLRRGSG